jgi:heat-inducible transcriptional repressor
MSTSALFESQSSRLNERQERILASVVEGYVSSARPLSSAMVVDSSHIPVSTATVRNELALLEDLGLVMQLHTSGGRIPTTAGYKYYIERLLPKSVVPTEDQVTIRHQFHQAQSEVDEWLRLAAAVLAHRAHTVAVVTTPKRNESYFRRVELVEAPPHNVLVIVVLSDGSVVQEGISVESPTPQETLRSIADALNRVYEGSTSVDEIDRRTGRLLAAIAPYGLEVVRLLRRAAARRFQLYHEGLGEMLTGPEFHPNSYTNLGAADKLRRVIDFLQQGIAMEDLLGIMAGEAGVQVMIGGQAPLLELEDYAMVLGRYGEETDASGVLGVLGPTRMDYGRAISLVRYMSELMTDLVFGRQG